MAKPIRILLQTTIPTAEDDWNITRFSLLRDYLASQKNEAGEALFEVTTRDRTPDESGSDPVLSNLGESDFDEIWLFGVDCGNGLTEKEGAGIAAFHQRGGGILATRDHNDLGISFAKLGRACNPVSKSHHFHTENPEPDLERQCIDDTYTTDITWPNYHSGANGDCQKVTVVEPVHELMRTPSGVVENLPSHPHEGAISVPPGTSHGRAIATGTSKVSKRPFNLIVAFERVEDAEGHKLGRAIAESSFHHLVDYNWDPDLGCPSFVTEAPSDRIQQNPQLLDDVKAYVRNAALWLSPQTA